MCVGPVEVQHGFQYPLYPGHRIADIAGYVRRGLAKADRLRKASVSVHQVDDGSVIDAVGSPAAGLAIIDMIGPRDGRDSCIGSGKADQRPGEGWAGQVGLELCRSIPVRVHGNEDDLNRPSTCSKLVQGVRQVRQGCRACIRTECVAKIDQRPFATKQVLVRRTTILVDEMKWSANCRLRGWRRRRTTSRE